MAVHYWICVICCASLLCCAPLKPVSVDLEKQAIPDFVDTLGKKARIIFDSSIYHLGVIKQGDKLKSNLHFKNLGPGDLIIDIATACECTTLDWPRLPIKKGQSGNFTIEYNSKDKEGLQRVDIDIIANTELPINSVSFMVTVVK